MLADDDPKADDSLAEKPVALPPPHLNADWPQVGGAAGPASVLSRWTTPPSTSGAAAVVAARMTVGV